MGNVDAVAREAEELGNIWRAGEKSLSGYAATLTKAKKLKAHCAEAALRLRKGPSRKFILKFRTVAIDIEKATRQKLNARFFPA